MVYSQFETQWRETIMWCPLPAQVILSSSMPTLLLAIFSHKCYWSTGCCIRELHQYVCNTKACKVSIAVKSWYRQRPGQQHASQICSFSFLAVHGVMGARCSLIIGLSYFDKHFDISLLLYLATSIKSLPIKPHNIKFGQTQTNSNTSMWFDKFGHEGGQQQ